MSPGNRDRRRHVRVSPSLELPAEVSLVPAGECSLMVVDVSIGGLGLWVQRGVGHELGQRLTLQLRLGGKPIEVDAEVRHRSPDGQKQGMEFVDVPQEARTVINGYVSALVQRGHRA